jgi:hypothetical protein
MLIFLAKKFRQNFWRKEVRPYFCPPIVKWTCESSSVGRARPCQGRGRGFETRLSLHFNKPTREVGFFVRKNLKFHFGILGCRDGGIGRHAGLKILWQQCRAGSIPAPGTKQKPLIFRGFFVFDVSNFKKA